MNDIQFILNGKTVSYAGSAADRLLDVLRDTFRCTSVKCGCKEGECGACSVLLDGRLINSCCVAMGAVEGSTIVTLEGYRETETFRSTGQGVCGGIRRAVRLLHPRHGAGGGEHSVREPAPHRGGSPCGYVWQSLPLHGL